MKIVKLFKVLAIALIIFPVLGYGQNNDADPKFSMVEVQINNGLQLQELISNGLDIVHQSTKKNNKVQIIAQTHDMDKIAGLGYDYQVIHEDMSKYLQSRLDNPSSKSLQIGQGSMGGYFTYSETLSYIDSMQLEYSNIMSVPTSIGQTIEGNDIMAYKISDNPGSAESEPQCLITGLHHAREPMSIIAPLYFTQWLLSNYGTNDMATYMVDNREIWIVPVLNVDGYLYNEQIEPNGGGMWRKNKRDNDQDGTFDPNYDGVDLNRNYGYGWGYNNNGSSPDPTSETYRGTEAFSEPETEAIRQFCISNDFKTALNFHTFGDLFIYPGEPDGTTFPDQFLFREYSHDATKGNGYVFGNGPETVQYATNGDSDAWMYGEQTEKDKIMAFTPEIGNQFDYFWAPTGRIIELAEENLYPQQYMVMAAGVYLKLEDYRYDDSTGGDGDLAAEANETVDLIFTVKNKGWEMDAQNVTATLSSDDANVTINNATATGSFDSLATQELVFNITLSGQITPGYTTTVDVHFIDANGYDITETHELIFGKPFIKFFDNAENGTDEWIAEGTWNTTDEKSFDGMYSFTDSPNDTYQSNSETSLILSNPVDLTGLNNAMLTFKTRYNMERDWDMAQLQISTDNGNTWEPIGGEYSTNGAGNDGVQTLNTPVYNGFRDLAWVEETVSLIPYIGEQVQTRFLIATDVAIETDGWYIDDIKLIGYTDQPVMPGILSVTKYNNTDSLGPYPVHATVSDEQGNLDVDLLYSVNNGDFTSIDMQAEDFFTFSSEIPQMTLGTTVSYYVRVTDTDNNMDSTDVVEFLVTDGPPEISVNIDEINSELPIGQNEEHVLTIANNGLLPLHWNISSVSVGQKDPVQIITDPEGDQTADSPDILGMNAEQLNDSEVFMELEFADNINPNTMLAIVLADTDQDNETGATGEELFGYPGWDIGGEYMVIYDPGNQYGNGSLAFVTDETGNNLLGTMDITINNNKMSVIVPLEYMDNDDGNMDVTSICGSPQGFDAAPNEGHGTIGNPGVAAWLDINIEEGTTYASNTADVIITLGGTSIQPGIYYAEILVESNDPSNPTISIPVSLTILSNENDILTFNIEPQASSTNIDETSHEVFVQVLDDPSNLVAEFTLSDGAVATIDGVVQVSGTTPNDFTDPVIYTITADDGISVQDWTVIVENVEGIKNENENKFMVYPNPASNKLYVKGAKNSRIVIYNLLGEPLLYLYDYEMNTPIDISMLQNGIYLMNIHENNKVMSKKFHVVR